MEEVVFMFQSTAQAIKAEQMLIQGGLQPRVMSIPQSIRAGCGIGLRVEKQLEEAAKTLLAGVPFQTFFR